MGWLRGIRLRFLLATLGVTAVAIGAAALIADRLLAAAAARAVRRDIERTAGLVASAGFAGTGPVLERIGSFLGADIATLDPDGRTIASTLRGTRMTDLERLLAAAPAGETVLETSLAGAPVTIGRAALGDGAIALVFPGHLLGARRALALSGLAAVALGALALAAAGSLLAARSVVRPLEDLARSAGRIAAGERDARLEVRTGDEIEALARALETMVKSLREAERLAAIGRLTAALAHEIRNPLTSIRMALEIEAERLPEGRARESLRVVLREVEKLGLVAGKLLAFAGRPGAAPALNLREGPIGPVVEDVLALLAPQLEHRAVRLERDLADDLPDARIDPDTFRHVVLNLVQNAIEAMPQGGAVRVATRAGEGGGAIRLEVADEGPGVAPEDVPRLFEPFFTRKETGTGLGLAIARAVAEAHGGSIRYRPRAPRGSVFEVEVPCRRS